MNILATARKNSAKKSAENDIYIKGVQSKKNARAAGTVSAKEITSAKKALTAERKNIISVVAFLATAETPEAETIREILSLPKNASAKVRKAVIKDITANYPYVIRNYYIELGNEGDNYIAGDCVPCNRNGKMYVDMLPAICDYLRDRARVNATRKEYARQLLQVRAYRISEDNYTATTIKQALNYTRNAPAKLPRQKEVAHNFIRK